MTRKTIVMPILILCIWCFPVAAQEQSSRWQKHASAGQDAMKNRQYEEAERRFEEALKEAESFGSRDQRLILTIDNLARARHFQKKYVEAEPLYLRALDILEAMYGPEHQSVASRLIDLSQFYYSQPDRKAEAEPLMIRALKIQEKVLGPDNPQVSFTLIQLGYWYGLSGRDSDAEPILLRALSIQQKVYGQEAPILNTGLTYLAAVRMRQGKVDEVEALYRQVQDILEKSLLSKETKASPGPVALSNDEERLQNARGYAARLKNLTSFYIAQRRYDEAEAQYQHALKMLEQEFGKNHFTVGMVLESYAAMLRRVNRVAEAEKIEARARMIKEAASSK
ncbi:MAG: tetratricopeptide repeat protein [Acidobacteriota bacterium]